VNTDISGLAEGTESNHLGNNVHAKPKLTSDIIYLSSTPCSVLQKFVSDAKEGKMPNTS